MSAPEPMTAERLAEIRDSVAHGLPLDRNDMPALLAEITRLRSEATATRAAVLDEAADAVARFTGNDLDANAKMLRRMAAAARDAQTGGAA